MITKALQFWQLAEYLQCKPWFLRPLFIKDDDYLSQEVLKITCPLCVK